MNPEQPRAAAAAASADGALPLETPCIELKLPGGERASVAPFGAQVLSWSTADGVERLYLSPDAVFDGALPIRGGIPVCFPQFNVRGPLPKHGIARTLRWQPQPSDDPACASFTLRDSEATRRLWPHAFEARLSVQLSSGCLHLGFEALNSSDSAPWSFTFALHSYLRVRNIGQARLAGLQGLGFWDALTDRRGQIERAGELGFDGPVDRVYSGVPAHAAFELREPGRRLRITQSETLADTVVWNPGVELSAALPDMPRDGYLQMLCVEAAGIEQPVQLEPGQRWQAWQRLEALE